METKFIEIIKNCNSYDELHRNISRESNSNTEKGFYFELFTKYLFKYNYRFKNKIKEYYRLCETPISILKELEIPTNDIGIDGIIITHENEYIAVQVKFRSDINKIIKYEKLGTFLGTSFFKSPVFNKGIIVTSTYLVTDKIEKKIEEENEKNIKKNIKEKSVTVINNDVLSSLSEEFFSIIKSVIVNNIVPEIKHRIKPRDYQFDIIRNAMDHFDKNDNGRLYMACGTGKTITSLCICKIIKAKRSIIGVPSLYLLSQIFDTYVTYMPKRKFLLVGSDVDTNYSYSGLIITTSKEEIESFMNKYKDCNIVIITTYQSAELVAKVSKKLKFEFDFGIVDEAHKTVGNIEKAFSILLNNDLISIKKRMFMTATEKVFVKSNNKNKEPIEEFSDKDYGKILSMDNELIYGKIISNYSLKKAITNKYLSDYKIIGMGILEESIEELFTKNQVVKYNGKVMESRILINAHLIIESFKNHSDISHMLTFSNYNNDAKKLHDILDKMKESQGLKIFILSGDSPMKYRSRVIKEFLESPKAILCSARIFNEGVDIPKVNAVCFVDNKSSTVDIVQCVGRALRPYPQKEMAYIIIPTVINDHLFKDKNAEFGKLRNILKAISTVDDRITEEFALKKLGKFNGSNARFNMEYTETVEVIKEIEDLGDKITTVLCNKDGNIQWNIKFIKLKEFVEKYKKLPSEKAKNDKEKGLAWWCSKQRGAHKNNKLSQERIEALNTIDIWYWEQDLDGQWYESFHKVQKFVEKYNKLPRRSKNKKERKLGRWCGRQRIAHKNNKLSQERIEALNTIDLWYWLK